MNDEIKEILDNPKILMLSYGNYISLDDYVKLKDYITNLQTIEQQYSAVLSENAELENKITNLQEENEYLKKEKKKISQQHIYTLDKLIETQTKIENAIEYIKENEYIDLNGYDLLKILGSDEE